MKMKCRLSMLVVWVVLSAATNLHAKDPDSTNVIADPPTVGGESAGKVQVAHVVYARDKSSECFSDHFLKRAEKDSEVSTSQRLHSVELDTDDLYGYPLLIMTGEGSFALTEIERKNLRTFVQRGGFLLASAGCSSKEWDTSFRREMSKVFSDIKMEPLKMDHLVFHTVYDIDRLNGKNDPPKPLEGIHIGSRLGVLYSQDGLNDTKHKEGCCCCGGNEITNSEMVNVNILVYSLLH